MTRNAHFTLSDVRNTRYTDYEHYIDALNELMEEENEQIDDEEYS